MKERNVFDNLSPLDYRYWDKEVADYLSEEAFTKFKLQVEVALIEVLYDHDLCRKKIVEEVKRACQQIITEEVYKEEERIHHDTRALVNCLRLKVSEEVKPFVHMTATSFDISDTANALRFKWVINDVVLPALIDFEKILIPAIRQRTIKR